MGKTLSKPLVKPPVWMSDIMREVLVDHIDGSAPFSVKDLVRNQSLRGCISHGLIRWDQYSVRPDQTHITPKGREMLALVLAYYADVLAVAAHHRDSALIRLHMEKIAAQPAHS